MQHVVLHRVEGVERRHLLGLALQPAGHGGSMYSSRSSNILTWVPRLNRLPSSSLSCRVSRMVCMIVSAAVRFITRSPTVLAANRTHSTGLMPLMSSA